MTVGVLGKGSPSADGVSAPLCFALSWCICRGEKMEGLMPLKGREGCAGSRRKVNVVGSGFVVRRVREEAS